MSPFKTFSWWLFCFALSFKLMGEALPNISWQQLAPIPDSQGFAAPFSGVSGGSLIVAGGANFPDKKPWEGGSKIWHKKVFALRSLTSQWTQLGDLPRPLAYGTSVDIDDGLLCIGGSDADQHYQDVFLIQVRDSKLELIPYPPLPLSLAHHSAIRNGRYIYVAGGIESPSSTQASTVFLRLDLQALDHGWKPLKPLPHPRFLGAMAKHEDKIYFLGGASYLAIDSVKNTPIRDWHTDIFQYQPEKDEWITLDRLPLPMVASPQPIPSTRDAKLLLFAGDDGKQVNTAPFEHVGFPRIARVWNPRRPHEFKELELPFGFVTTTSVFWQNGVVICGGEIRPGIRSTQVWFSQDLLLPP